MTRILLLSEDADLSELKRELEARATDCNILLPGEQGAESAEVAVCWNPPAGALGALPRLRLIHSIAAGVDHLANDPSLPQIATCRVVDPDLRRGMAEYIIWGVLHHFRRFDQVLPQQPLGQWLAPPQRPARDWQVGVLGLGELGAYAAERLAEMGFSVRGWSRSRKEISGVSTWYGHEQLAPFSHGLDCVICLLPLTEESKGILNAELFARMRKGGVVINSGRGGHLITTDLLNALETGVLRAALLDAFDIEPLPAHDPLRTTAGVTITPHMASSASNSTIAEQVLENVRRLREGRRLLNKIDASRGY